MWCKYIGSWLCVRSVAFVAAELLPRGRVPRGVLALAGYVPRCVSWQDTPTQLLPHLLVCADHVHRVDHHLQAAAP